MKHPQFKSYQFKESAHWQLGVIENMLTTDSSGLTVLPGFNLELVANTDTDEAVVALDHGPCKHLYWVDSESGELKRILNSGLQTLGTLSEAKGAVKLAMGAQRLWLLTKTKQHDSHSDHKPEKSHYSLNSYVMPDLHLLRQLESKLQRSILDMAGDGRDGVWWLEGGDTREVVLYHVDRYGCITHSHILSLIRLNQAKLDVTRCGSKIVILESEISDDKADSDPCRAQQASWRLIVVDGNTGKYRIYDDIGIIDPAFSPSLLSIDNTKHIHLIGTGTIPKKDKKITQLWSLSLEGELTARRQPRFPPKVLSITAISASTNITVATNAGIIHLHPVQTTSVQGEERCSTFITPTLISPDGTPSGWQRADIDVNLPAGTTLEVSCASTKDQGVLNSINRILQDESHTSAFKVDKLNKRLVWRTEDVVVYASSDVDDEVTRLRYPLHQVDQTHLWLRFRFYTPPGRRTPTLKSLSVNYPNRSYLHDLPAIYREDPQSAAALRSFLAIFETLFGDLDTVIDQLPSHIDPDTAPESWLPFLLRWLGLPSPAGLSSALQRRLLKAAPKLLTSRGTHAALLKLLEILSADIADVSIQIIDVAAGPAPWVLQEKTRRGFVARLGRDTLIVAKQPVAFCLGTARLGLAKGVPLGQGRTNAKLVFAQRSGQIHIRIGASASVKQSLEPIIKIFLPYFVPAHCRYQLKFVPNIAQPWKQRLDDDLRLMDGAGSRLGSETIAGQFHLPQVLSDEIILDLNACLDQGLHLN